MKRSRVASEALRWVVWMKTPASIGQHLPAFEKWLMADRENWVTYMRVRREWSRWTRLTRLLSQDPFGVVKKLLTVERKRIVACTHCDILWIALGISVLVLLLK